MSITSKIRAKLYRAWLSKQSLDALKARLASRRGVLGLCYHAFDAEFERYPYRTSPEAFDAHLTFLKEVFEIVSVQQAVDKLRRGGLDVCDRPLALICFDDGYRCNWTKVTPLLERHNLPATLFAARDLIRQQGRTYLSETELVTLAAHPLWEVGGHGITHNVLTGFLPEDQKYEIAQSAAWLNDLLGPATRGFAYPQGQLNRSVVAQTQQHFAYGLATDQRLSPTFDPYQIRRFCPVSVHDDLHLFAQALMTAPLERP